MAITKCAECQVPISTQAKARPTCGAPVPKATSSTGILWLLILGVVVFIAIALGTPETQTAPDTAADACLMAREFVKDRLKAPASADFDDCASENPKGAAFHEKGGDWEVNGFADAQNSFGAKIRTGYFVRLRHEDGKTWRASSVVLDPT